MVVQTDEFNVYTWGDGKSGQLGLGDKIRQATAPTLLTTIPESIVHVCSTRVC
jgi:alpha-tubulin suppressor-like RCC1 family protein